MKKGQNRDPTRAAKRAQNEVQNSTSQNRGAIWITLCNHAFPKSRCCAIMLQTSCTVEIMVLPKRAVLGVVNRGPNCAISCPRTCTVLVAAIANWHHVLGKQRVQKQQHKMHVFPGHRPVEIIANCAVCC